MVYVYDDIDKAEFMMKNHSSERTPLFSNYDSKNQLKKRSFYASPWPRFTHMFDIITVVLEEQFHFILSLRVTLAIYQGHSGSRQSNLLRYIISQYDLSSYQHKTLDDHQIHKIVNNYRHVCQRFEVTLTKHALFHDGLIIQQ